MFLIHDVGDAISALPHSYYRYLLLALLLALSGPVLYPRRKQRYVPGVPIVGLEESGDIKQARENFCKDAKTMLMEGYRKACRLPILMLQVSWAKQRTVQKSRPVLCPQPTRRTLDDSSQVRRGAQDSTSAGGGFCRYLLRGRCPTNLYLNFESSANEKYQDV